MIHHPTYHKIDSMFLRDPATKHRTFLMGQWTRPEFGYLADLPWEATEKVDGTNIRIHLTEPVPLVGGRTERAELPKPLKSRLDDIAWTAHGKLPSGLTLYGEGCGPGIQKGGGNYGHDQDFVLFDVMTDGGMFLERDNVEDIARTIDVRCAPVLYTFTLHEAIDRLSQGRAPESRVAHKPGSSIEGFVLRPQVELRNRRGDRVITKLKVRDFQ